MRLNAIQQETAPAPGESSRQPGGYDPYSSADIWPPPRDERRRTLDDMRRLSEEIKLARACETNDA